MAVLFHWDIPWVLLVAELRRIWYMNFITNLVNPTSITSAAHALEAVKELPLFWKTSSPIPGTCRMIEQ
jgi:hypothetical protein